MVEIVGVGITTDSLSVTEPVMESSLEDVDEIVTIASLSTSVEDSVLVNAEEGESGAPPVELVGCSWESDASCANVDKEKVGVVVEEIDSKSVGKGRSVMVVEIVGKAAGFS